MTSKPKRRTVNENGDTGEDLVLATLVGNGEDLSPLVRHAFEIGRPEPLLQQLRHLSKKKEAEIEELCRLHYEEFIVAVDELRGVLVDAEELKSVLQCDNLRLQDVGASLLSKLDYLLESYAIKKNVTEALKMSKLCVQVLQLCSKCNDHVTQGRFYPALKTIDLIEKNYLQHIPVKKIRVAVERRLPAMNMHIEKKVCNEVNEWLVHIRSNAKDIGQAAISHTSYAQQRDREMLSRQREAEENCESGSANFSFSLDVEESDEDSALKFDLTPIYRAYHIHKCLEIQEKFRDYYYNNRLLQLNSDLQISLSQPFLDYYQTFLALVAGYFIVEDCVLRTGDGLLTATQVETMWESAVAKTTKILEQQFARINSPSPLLKVKDYVILLAATLRQYGYEVSAFLDVLEGTQEKYHKLLLDECRQKISQAIAADSYEQMVLKSDAEYLENVLSLQLQTTDIMPAFPYIAPFSVMVPEICRIIISFIQDSVSYLSNGSDGSIFDAARKYLDQLLIDILNEIILNKISDGSLGVSAAMQTAANISVLERACDFFLKVTAQTCGVPARLAERLQSSLAAKVVLKTSRDAAYIALLSSVNDKLNEYMALPESINWTSDTPQGAHEYMNEVILYLDTLMSTAQQILPMDAMYKVGAGALEHISNAILGAFLNDNVKRFNANAVMGVNNDLQILENFAEERFHSSGLSEVYKDGSFMEYLLEPRQLVNLLLSSQPENFMNPVIRQKNYSTLEYKKVAIICEKFKDSPDSLFGSLSNRNSKQSSQKRSMEALKRRLRDFS